MNNVQAMEVKGQKGFTLIELMIVVAIIGILAAVALPAYQDYTKKSKFAEVVTQVGAARTAVELCYQTEGALTTCDAGEGSIPAAVLTGTYNNLDTMSILDGVITATATAAADSKTMVVTPVASAAGVLAWTTAGTCLAEGWCK